MKDKIIKIIRPGEHCDCFNDSRYGRLTNKIIALFEKEGYVKKELIRVCAEINKCDGTRIVKQNHLPFHKMKYTKEPCPCKGKGFIIEENLITNKGGS